MGTACSVSAYGAEQRKQVQMKVVEKKLKAMGVKKSESEALYTVFDKLDSSNDGFLQLAEFEKLLSIAPKRGSAARSHSALRERLYGCFDRNGDGEINYSEFLVGVFKWCTYTRYSLIDLSFQLLDKDASGVIDMFEVLQLVQEMIEDPTFDKSLVADLHIHDLFSKFDLKVPVAGGGSGKDEPMEEEPPANVLVVDVNKKKAPPRKKAKAAAQTKDRASLNMSRFTRFALKHPAILYPASRVQELMRTRILGVDWWQNASARRSEEATNDTLTFVLDIKRSCVQDDGLTTALVLLKDAKVLTKELADERTASMFHREWNGMYGSTKDLTGVLNSISGSMTHMGGSIRDMLSGAGGKAAGKPPLGAKKPPTLAQRGEVILVDGVQGQDASMRGSGTSSAASSRPSSKENTVDGSVVTSRAAAPTVNPGKVNSSRPKLVHGGSTGNGGSTGTSSGPHPAAATSPSGSGPMVDFTSTPELRTVRSFTAEQAQGLKSAASSQKMKAVASFHMQSKRALEMKSVPSSGPGGMKWTDDAVLLEASALIRNAGPVHLASPSGNTAGGASSVTAGTPGSGHSAVNTASDSFWSGSKLGGVHGSGRSARVVPS